MSRSFDLLSSALTNKLSDSPRRTFYLGLWAGYYITTGGILYGVISSFSGNSELIKLIAASSFSIGLNLVIFKKAQLFTGNNLMFISLIQKKTQIIGLIKNWSFVYLGNLIGSLLLVILTYYILLNQLDLSIHFKNIALKKVHYPVEVSFYKAILCNILVCIAIWFGVTLKHTLYKVIGIVIPITAFVFLGFEHSVANMFFIPLGLSFSELPLSSSFTLFMRNIIPVTIGNIVGGFILSALLLSLSKNRNKT